MLYYERIKVFKDVEVNKTRTSKERTICVIECIIKVLQKCLDFN